MRPGLVSGPTTIASSFEHWHGGDSWQSRDPILAQGAMMGLVNPMIPPEGAWPKSDNGAMTAIYQGGKRQLLHPVLDTYNQDPHLRPRQRRRKQTLYADDQNQDVSLTATFPENKR